MSTPKECEDFGNWNLNDQDVVNDIWVTNFLRSSYKKFDKQLEIALSNQSSDKFSDLQTAIEPMMEYLFSKKWNPSLLIGIPDCDSMDYDYLIFSERSNCLKVYSTSSGPQVLPQLLTERQTLKVINKSEYNNFPECTQIFPKLPDSFPLSDSADEKVSPNRINRVNFSLFVKIFFLLLIMNAPYHILLSYFFLVILHINGFFDDILDLFSRLDDTSSLYRVLLSIQDPSNRVPNESTTQEQAGTTSHTDDQNDKLQSKPHESEPNPMSSNRRRSPPSIVFRWFYQTVVIFFLSLLPWWHPNPEYL